MKLIARGAWYVAMLSRGQAMSLSAVSEAPHLFTMNAFTTSPLSESGRPMTAACATAGCLMRMVCPSLGKHAVARHLDHFLEAADEGEVAVGVELTHVAGMRPAVAQGRRRRFGFVPVALERAGAGWHDLADLAGRHVGLRDGVEDEDEDGHARAPRYLVCPSRARGAAFRCRR